MEGPNSPLEETLGFQNELIVDGCLTPDSRCFLSVDKSDFLVWDVANRKVSQRFRLDDCSPTAIACDGVHVIVATREGPILIFDLKTGRPLAPLPGHQHATLAAVFLSDGSLATGGTDGSIRIWNVPQCLETARIDLGDHSVSCIRPLSNNRIAVGHDPSIDDHNCIRIYSLQNPQQIEHFGNHEWDVDHIAVSPDESLLAAGANDEITIWRLADCSPVYRIHTHNTKCQSLAFIEPQLLASGDSSGRLQIWNAQTGTVVRRLPSHSGLISSISPSHDKRFFTTSWDQSVRVWNTDGLTAEKPLCHEQPVTTVAFYPDDKRFVSGSEDGNLIIWDGPQGTPLACLIGHSHWVSSVTVGPNIVSASWDGTIRIWDTDSFECLGVINTGDEHISHMACSADGTIVATASRAGTVRVWNLIEGRQLSSVHSPETEVRSIAFANDGSKLRWGTYQRQFFEWSMENAKPNMTQIPGTAPATQWDLNQRSGLSVVGLSNGQLILFDEMGTPTYEFGVPGCGPAAIVCSKYGEFVLTAGGLPRMASDHTARLWQSGVTEPIAIFIAEVPFTSAALAHDVSRAVLGDVTGAVHFLELIKTD